MNLFFADYKAMESKCSRLNDLNKQLLKQMERLENIMDNLKTEFSGSAADAYFMAFNADMILFITVTDKIQLIINLLSSAINEYQKGEEMVNSRIGDIRI